MTVRGVAGMRGVRVYLAGDLSPWRPPVAQWLASLGAVTVDPMTAAFNTPSTIGDRIDRRAAGDWAAYAATMREVRAADLALVRSCGVLVARLESDVPLCGTYEELFTAAQLGIPCYVIARKSVVLPWIFGVVPPDRMVDDVAGLGPLLA